MKKKLFPILCFFLVLCSMLPAAQASAATFNIDFETYSAAIELVNLDTDTIVYQKNATARREPASTTKIMTFIIVSEQIQDLDNTQVTVTKEVVDQLLGTGSSLSGIKEGDVLTVMQLLNCGLREQRQRCRLCRSDEPKGAGAWLPGHPFHQPAWAA